MVDYEHFKREWGQNLSMSIILVMMKIDNAVMIPLYNIYHKFIIECLQDFHSSSPVNTIIHHSLRQYYDNIYV